MAQHHPSGKDVVKKKAMEALRRNAKLDSCDGDGLRRLVAKGRRDVRDADEFARFCRYRVLRRKYILK